ncbi:IgGFc-binding protein-like [Saccoglossus kowalevskii]
MPSPGAGVGYDNFAFSGEIIAGIIIPEFSLGGKGGGPGEQGDPLVTTGDGFRYKLLGKPCEYIMFQEDSATPSFRVITNHVGGTVFGEEASFVGSVKVEYNGQVVELLEGNVIKVDAVDVTADLTVDYASFDGISLRWNNHVQKFVTVDIGPGLFEIVWNGYKGHVLVHPSADFSKQVTGLLGNFNEDQLDDLQYKDNGVWKTLTLDASSEDMAAFASGWLLDPNSCS